MVGFDKHKNDGQSTFMSSMKGLADTGTVVAYTVYSPRRASEKHTGECIRRYGMVFESVETDPHLAPEGRAIASIAIPDVATLTTRLPSNGPRAADARSDWHSGRSDQRTSSGEGGVPCR